MFCTCKLFQVSPVNMVKDKEQERVEVLFTCLQFGTGWKVTVEY